MKQEPARRSRFRSIVNIASPVRLAWRCAPRQLMLVVLGGVLSGSSAALPAYMLSRLVDDLGGEADSARLIVLVVLLGSSTALAGVLSYVAGLAGARLGVLVQEHMEVELAASMLRRTGIGYLEDPKSHDTVARAREAASESPTIVANGLLETITIIGGVASYALMLMIAWPLMGLLLIVVAVPMALLQRGATRASIRAAFASVDALRWRDYFQELFSSVSPAKEMRFYDCGQFMLDRLKAHLRAGLSYRLQEQAIAIRAQSAFTVINAIVFAVGTLFAALAAESGQLTIGEFVLFGTAVTLVQARCASLLSTAGQVVAASELFRSYGAFVAENGTQRSSYRDVVPQLRDGITLRGVWFRYRPDLPWVFRDLNLELPAAQTTVIIGSNGCGKSTLISLLLRLYEPTRGKVLWDGLDISDLPADRLRERMTGILQDFTAYEMSARENVMLSDIGAPNAVALADRAAEESGCLSIVRGLPEGWDTMLSQRRKSPTGADGTTLSGGQWQKLALARAFVRPAPEVVILDEGTSMLDPSSERSLLERLQRYPDAARVVISHRTAALEFADQVLVLDGGQVHQWSHVHAEDDSRRRDNAGRTP